MRSIWHQPFTLEDIRRFEVGTFASHIGIEFTEVGPDFLAGRMAVASHMRQPFGALHGGASVALAETLGSIGANFVVDPQKFRCVGQSINANHLRSVREGFVTGVARPVHLGTRSHVWRIDIANDRGQRVCVSSLTMAVLAREGLIDR